MRKKIRNLAVIILFSIIIKTVASENSVYLQHSRSVVNINKIKPVPSNIYFSHKSKRYGYTISIPSNFKAGIAKGSHIDTKFVDDNGSSILVNVSPRMKEEYSITAHYYSKEMLEQLYRQSTPNVAVTHYEKIVLSGEKALLVEMENGNPNLKSMECTFYHKDLVIIITCSCGKSLFNTYRQEFKQSILSVKI